MLRNWIGTAAGAAILGLLLAACGGADDPLYERLLLHEPRDGALPGNLAVEAADDAELGRPLHNNQGVHYLLRPRDEPGAGARLSIVVFTHGGAVQSFLQGLWDRGAVRAVMDEDLEQERPFTPGTPPRRDILCVEANGNDASATRVCMRAADRTLVVTELSDNNELFADVTFDIELLDAGADHAMALMADN